MLTPARRKCRNNLPKIVTIAIIAAAVVLCYSYVNLQFCYKVMSQSSLNYMCKKFERKEYRGTLCEELCNNLLSFNDFKCPENEMRTIVFTAVKSGGDIYAIKLAKYIRDNLSWTNAQGVEVYPKLEEFHNILKMHITLYYNVTLEDNMIRALINQEIDINSSEQMMSLWRLFKDNNYMISKLFEEDSLFPTILGTCGPYYATENLQILLPNNGVMRYISFDWQERLRIALNIMEYLFRLDEIKPETLKICKMKLDMFGITPYKRLKYQSAQYVDVESQLDKKLSNAAGCNEDEDCDWHHCKGKCDPEKLSCNSIQQNNNLQIFCEHILKGSALQPGLLASAKVSKGLQKLLKSCINPSNVEAYQIDGRPYAPNSDLAMRLYNEIKRLHKEDG